MKLRKDNIIKVPLLSKKYINNCRLLPQRWDILELLPKNSIAAEVGVLGGDWSEKIIKIVNPEKLVLIDSFYANDYPHFKRFTKNTHKQYIETKFGILGSQVEIKQGISWNCLAEYPDNYFDWIYIDAAHDYKSVKQDLEQSYRVLKPTGVIIMNDYIMFDKFTNKDYGVIQATNEFMIDNNFEMLYFALHQDMFCDVVIKKIEE